MNFLYCPKRKWNKYVKSEIVKCVLSEYFQKFMSALNLAAFLKVFSTFRNKILALSSSFLKIILE